jgi:hypothetical protein
MDFVKGSSPEDCQDGAIIFANALALVVRADKRQEHSGFLHSFSEDEDAQKLDKHRKTRRAGLLKGFPTGSLFRSENRNSHNHSRYVFPSSPPSSKPVLM